MIMIVMIIHLSNHRVKILYVKEADEIIKLKEQLKSRLKQNRVDEVSAKGNIQIQFEPITQRLDKVKKAVKQTNEDLSKKLDLTPINKKI